jgi:hypothetical protein
VLPDLHLMPKGTEMAGKALSGAFFHAPLCKIRESRDK